MKKHITILATTIFLISACAPATALPTETPTATTVPTQTPTPTSTPTPTLEPWMASLPENVVSVEVDGDSIFGLDTQGERVMEFDLETGEWEVIAIKDVDAWKLSVANETVAKAGRSSFLEYSNTDLDQNTRGLVQVNHKTWPVSMHTGRGRVLDDGVVEVQSDYLKGNGIDKAHVLLIAFPNTLGPTEVLAGVYKDGTYVPIIDHFLPAGISSRDHGEYQNIDKPEDLEFLKGQDIFLKIVSMAFYREWFNPNDLSSNWSHLLPESDEYYIMYKSKSALERDIYSIVVFDPNYYVMMDSFGDIIRSGNRPEHLESSRGSKTALALLSYVMDTTYAGTDSWLIPFSLGKNPEQYFDVIY
jgi:hypothetical protein